MDKRKSLDVFISSFLSQCNTFVIVDLDFLFIHFFRATIMPIKQILILLITACFSVNSYSQIDETLLYSRLT